MEVALTVSIKYKLKKTSFPHAASGTFTFPKDISAVRNNLKQLFKFYFTGNQN